MSLSIIHIYKNINMHIEMLSYVHVHVPNNSITFQDTFFSLQLIKESMTFVEEILFLLNSGAFY